MVVKMMKWPPWPPLPSRKYEVKLVIKKVKGVSCVESDGDDEVAKRRLVVEVKWKGQKIIGLGPLKRSIKRNFSEEGGFCGDGVFEWNEEFKSVCNLSGYKDGVFSPWEVYFTVFNGKQGPRNKDVVGTASLNLAEFVSAAKEEEFDIDVPLAGTAGISEDSPSLCLSLLLVELRTVQQHPPQAIETLMGCITQSPSSLGASSPQKDGASGFKAGLRKVKIFGSTKKAYQEGESSDGTRGAGSEDAEYNDSFDTDSLNDEGEVESDESNGESRALSLFCYGSVGYANFTIHPNAATDADGEGWVYYKNSSPDSQSLYVEYSTSEADDQQPGQRLKRRLLPWRKRKFSFRSKSKAKGEPLLKKYYGEEGGDDIDFDRRQLTSSDDSTLGWNKSEEGSTTSRSSVSEFGDDNFAVGGWESKEITSRDGNMKLQAQVFFASIDQRSERAAGESACTALVAVIANWLQSNPYEVPIKSEFDGLIRDGSLEWRNLCKNEDYKNRFPDKHFDLETILQAKIRPLSVIPEKSFIGFFHPEGLEGKDFDFLNGAMSFDSIWEEIRCHEADWPANGDSLVYIVSWNDHFFVLKVDQDAYYIIDTLGERLYEGCNQAYVLKFDKDTTIRRLPKEAKPASEDKSPQGKVLRANSKGKMSAEGTTQSPDEAAKSEMEEEIICNGKEACKEYIKNFLAAIPLRELQADIKKGLMASTPLHHRLQIEFHYTQLTQPAIECPGKDLIVADTTEMALAFALPVAV